VSAVLGPELLENALVVGFHRLGRTGRSPGRSPCSRVLSRRAVTLPVRGH
jgi:hypothetical protein